MCCMNGLSVGNACVYGTSNRNLIKNPIQIDPFSGSRKWKKSILILIKSQYNIMIKSDLRIFKTSSVRGHRGNVVEI